MLKINKLNAYYGDFQALWDVSIAIKEGEIATLIGSNNAGKSTIMRAITGLLKLKVGKITFDDVRIDRLPPHHIVEMGICMVPEGRRLFPSLTVQENLEVGASSKSARRIKGQTLTWIYEIFPILKGKAKQPAGTLSGGEQQMVAIGRALMSNPRLLMIDEMSLGLSPVIVQELCRIIREINMTKKLTILLVEQDVHLALRLADRGYIIENGRIVGHGNSLDLLSSEKIKEAYLGIRTDNKAN